MKIDEIVITKAIVEDFMNVFLEYTEVDVAIAGAGPSGMVAAYYIAKEGAKVAIFERKLSVGGGMWGGGMMFPRIVIQDEAKHILDDFEINYWRYKEGYLLANSIEVVGKLASETIAAGAEIFNLMSVEDVMIREGKITGVVINWSSVELGRLHVDPLCVRSNVIIDGTGHDAEICRNFERKMPDLLKVVGEKPMWADVGERSILENTKEIYPGLIAVGMAANTVAGGPRMGPIFGGMMLSGEKASKLALSKL
ncbi:MAG: sulfide-dependent adenosine diphosphate thiazole synthase [Methanocellales archaeon]|nr:sulfide-dependent adenosine diphosphate thiazole synthase [Methanocellales archaeon]MDD3420731.1 sulfide-dependent adenosine diphosphate thiazole synthase [Methanocellales archaeon]MDD4898090.1 sulfide-dependent adenosine diphosphate thiazole synthase [Methanocellales archaeon]MDD5447215.1 sulfide-dependent adenosine diphosphate thiazole synthase [Methanocellales archaeon]